MDYQAIKDRELLRAKGYIYECETNDDPAFPHKGDARPITDLRHMVRTSVEKNGDKTAFLYKFNRKEEYRSISYNEAYDDINGLGTSMAQLGLVGKRVAVIGENSYQWGISYLAVTMGGGVIIPMDKEISAEEIKRLLIQSEAEAVMFSKRFRNLFAKIREEGETGIKIFVDFEIEEDSEDAYSWSRLVKEGRRMVQDGDRRYLDAPVYADELSVLLFTSGTTGVSKTVMLTQANLCYNLMALPYMINIKDDDVLFMILPIHHTYACTIGLLAPLYYGATIAYGEGLKYLLKNLKETKPTIFLGVPLIFDRMYRTILKTIKKQNKEKSFERVIKLNRKTSKLGLNISKRFLSEIINIFGGRMRLLVCGGAAVDPAVLDFFNDIGILTVQGYGLTETAPLVAALPDVRKNFRNSSAGHVLPGLEYMVWDKDEDGVGELCFRGPNVMMGYYKNPEETAKAIIDGWFHTGDIGYIDDEGYVYITGRKKNVIITANGKNVFPEELEYFLGKVPYIEECMVWADQDEDGHDNVIVATVVPNMEAIAEAKGEMIEDMAEIEKIIWEEVDKINEDLPVFKKIVRLVIRKEEFEKTTAQKIKRFAAGNKKQG